MIIDKIRQLMEFHNISQKKLANRLNITEVAVSRYLNGNRVITIEFAVKISEEFNVSLDWLLK